MRKIVLVMSIAVSLMAVEKSNEITTLSSGIRSLLSQEMIQVEKSMKNIFSDIIAGKYENISNEAIGIKNSFILKRNLTKSQKQELHSKVSKEFISLDKSFHEDAGKLANAAEFEDKKQINLYYSKMIDTCVKCHSKFATYRFKNFK